MQRRRAFTFLLTLLVFVALILLLFHWTHSGVQPHRVEVAPACADFYERYGGEAFFGPPLAPATPLEHGRFRQTFANAELLCDAQGGAQLVPLGAMLIPAEAAPPSQADPHIAAWVEAHGGQMLFGRPLTRLRYNRPRQRWEQHFENLGVALGADGVPHLLPYGSIAWEGQIGPTNAIISVSRGMGAFPAPFYPLLRALGGLSVVGQPLTPPYLNWHSGAYEIAFQNAVLGLPFERLYTQVQVQPVVSTYHLGFTSPPTERQEDPFLRFWPTGPGVLGYHIPLPFMTYLQQHGGAALLCGAPISERRVAPDGMYEQWCTNIGLAYNPHTQTTFLRPVGERFVEQVYPQVSALPQPVPGGPQAKIYLPKQTKLGSTLTITVVALDPQGNPVPNQKVILFPPAQALPQATLTNSRGVGIFQVLLDAPTLSGAQIFQACLWLGPGQANCQAKSTLILP